MGVKKQKQKNIYIYIWSLKDAQLCSPVVFLINMSNQTPEMFPLLRNCSVTQPCMESGL